MNIQEIQNQRNELNKISKDIANRMSRLDVLEADVILQELKSQLENHNPQIDVKKGVGTLSNPLPVGQQNETEDSLQIGRSGSGVADNKHPADNSSPLSLTYVNESDGEKGGDDALLITNSDIKKVEGLPDKFQRLKKINKQRQKDAQGCGRKE